MSDVWWETVSVPQGHRQRKQIGPLSLEICREPHECLVRYDYRTGWNDEHEVVGGGQGEAAPTESQVERYIISDADDIFHVQAVLADRPVVTQPVTPFYLPARHKATIFVSTPLWVRIAHGTEPVTLTDIAIDRPSDTWFGPDTMEGEFCYASRTSARLDVGKLPKRIHRATTPVHLSNDAAAHLLLVRINLPVIYLDMFRDLENRIWTQAVKMVKASNGETEELRILPGPPPEAAGATFLRKARQTIPDKKIIRKISGFFG